MARSFIAAKKAEQHPEEAILNNPQAWPEKVIICVGQQEWDGAYVHHLTLSEADAQRQLRDWAQHNITGVYRVIQTPHDARAIVVLGQGK